MPHLMDDEELWRRLNSLPKGTFLAFLDFCRVNQTQGKPLKARTGTVSQPLRERLSEGLRLFEVGRLIFQQIRMHKTGRRKVVAVCTPDETVVPRQSLPYLQSLRPKHGHTNLSLPPLPGRIQFGR